MYKVLSISKKITPESILAQINDLLHYIEEAENQVKKSDQNKSESKGHLFEVIVKNLFFHHRSLVQTTRYFVPNLLRDLEKYMLFDEYRMKEHPRYFLCKALALDKKEARSAFNKLFTRSSFQEMIYEDAVQYGLTFFRSWVEEVRYSIEDYIEREELKLVDVDIRDGWRFFSPKNVKKTTKQKIGTLARLKWKKFVHSRHSTPSAPTLNSELQALQIDIDQERALYKFHIMPAQSHLSQVLKVLHHLSLSNKVFRENIPTYKVLLDHFEPLDDLGQIIPTIVIYTKSFQCAKKTLAVLENAFRGKENWASGSTPRFSYSLRSKTNKMGDLIFVAGGNSDTKIELLKSGLDLKKFTIHNGCFWLGQEILRPSS